MSSLSSKQVKSQVPAEIILAVTFILVLATLALFDSRLVNLYNSGASTLRGPGESSSIISGNETSFISDELYWSANCSHGWKSDSTCDDIVSRAKLCARGVDSAYCSEYNSYMKQFRSQLELRQYFPANIYDA